MRRFIIPLSIALFCASSCIVNDLPYPTVVPSVRSISFSGAESVVIDEVNNTVNVVFPETADISKVSLTGIVTDPGSAGISLPVPSDLDLSEPLRFSISTYQEYAWEIKSSQNIERYFTVQGQMGGSVIDDVNCRVIVYVSQKAKLDDIHVTSFKLGPADVSTYSCDPLSIRDFTSPVRIAVTYRGRTYDWDIYVERRTASVELTSLDAWSRVAWVRASGIEGETCGFRFRKAGASDWTEVPSDAVSMEGGSFSACIDGLEPLCGYECLAYCGKDVTEAVPFTTEEEKELPNAGFEVFSNQESQNYFSWFDPRSPAASTKWWDSGNAGSTTVGASAAICSPDTSDRTEGSASARLDSKYVVIKFAAGNLFCGEFAGLVGTSGGMVDFGRPFTLHPRKLVLSLKYKCGQIDNINGVPSGMTVSMGDNDRCQVFVALGTWDPRKYGGTPDCPVRVNTTRRETFFDKDGEDVIAYGSYVRDSSTDGWITVEIPLEYRTTSRKPTHIIISCAASMLGDYFTGSSGSTLWVDGMSLKY